MSWAWEEQWLLGERPERGGDSLKSRREEPPERQKGFFEMEACLFSGISVGFKRIGLEMSNSLADHG